MIRLHTLHQLKKQPPTADVVHVKTVNKLFKCHEGEWIERAYYTTAEVATMLDISTRSASRMIKKIGFRPPYDSSKSMNYEQLIILARVSKIKKEKPMMKYSAIKKVLGV